MTDSIKTLLFDLWDWVFYYIEIATFSYFLLLHID